MLIDLHCHTKVYSACSALTPDALVRAAQARGLDGVCITEHDALWPLADIQKLTGEMSFPVFRGMEVTTEVGHVLVFGAQRFRPEMATLSALRAIAQDEGALMYMAHPSRKYGTLPPDDLASWFDSVEAANGTEGMLQNEHASRIATTLRLPGIGGSDAHSVREVGTCATNFEEDVHTERALLAALSAGAYVASSV
jgi:predicted metal-dependent phosphoesterase TrpH